ncbi:MULTISPECIES: hypothetical protein [Haloarcula]|uniref:Uncharacterized protein n=1 Tax=Haloarcula pellucida TaxID=1427151 RepID=A0A830GPN0_9EURY|nr:MULTISPECIES: hypothetical protein [Halomicroarcula]MBX0350216.1 hypothetical protein [Halomicroarcula pellucida]MDS0277682.1 hypothetical protein [Halomicroarcula sp. S1AR25-4]GGO00954.1 hypothetical protein GCM10009030_34150 [Halomicroarcula pellucida]
MTTPRQRRFLYAQVGLTLVATAILATVGALTLEHVFVVSFLGFVVLTALTAPVHVTPRWRSRLRWPLLAGAVAFLVLVGLRTLEKFVGSL